MTYGPAPAVPGFRVGVHWRRVGGSVSPAGAGRSGLGRLARLGVTRGVILGSDNSNHDQGSIGVSIASPKVSADAPGSGVTASRLTDGAAGLLPAAVHRNAADPASRAPGCRR